MPKLSIFRGKGPPDTTPNAFSFTPATGAPLSTLETSNTITISGLTSGVSVAATVTGGQYSRNGGAASSVATTATNGTTFAALNTSSALNSTMTSTVLTVGGVAASYDVTTVSSSGIPLLQPSGIYTGAPLSGWNTAVTPPWADPARTLGGGKPAMMWLRGYNAMSVGPDEEIIGIEAECPGGMNYVEVQLEGGNIEQLHRSVQTIYSPLTGQNENLLAYWFKISFPTGQRGQGYRARLFARGVPNDPSLQARVIGWYDGQYGNWNVPVDTGVPNYRAPTNQGEADGLKPFWVCPRLSKYDAVKHVKADGTGDYLTLRAALNALAALTNAAWQAPPNSSQGDYAWDIVLHDASNEWGIPTTFAALFGSEGNCAATRIRAAQGVTARIYHNSSWDPYNTVTVVSSENIGSWDAYPIVNNFEFYGGHDGTDEHGDTHGTLVVDTANYRRVMIRAPYSTIAFRGAGLTNSTVVAAGDMFHIYQNGQTGIWSNFQYFQDPSKICISNVETTQKYATMGYGALQEWRTWRVNGILPNPHDNCHSILEGYTCGYDGTFNISQKAALRISYTGGGTTAVFRITAGVVTADRLLELIVNGSTVASVTLRNPDIFTAPSIGTGAFGTSVATMTQLATWINAQSALGFACVEPPASLGTVWCAYTVEFGGGGTFTSADIKAATISFGYLTANSWMDSHNEYTHWIGNSGFENALVLRNIEVQSHWSTGHIIIESTDSVPSPGTNLARDICIAYSLSYATNQSWAELHSLGGPGNGNGIGLYGDNVALINCTFPDNVASYQATLAYPYTGMWNTVIDANELGGFGTQWPASSSMKMVASAHKSAALSPAQPTWGTSDWIWSTTGYALFQGLNDMRPLSAAQMASHKVSYTSSLQAYDVVGNLYAGTDFIGCFAGASANYTAPLATFSDATYPVT